MRPVIVKPKPYTMKDVLNLVFQVFETRKKVRFSSLVQQRDRGFVVYLFVSLLELVREGNLSLTQTGNFSEIVLLRRGAFSVEQKDQLVARFD